MTARLLALALLTLLGATTASATLVAVDVGTLQVFTQSADIPLPLDATVTFEPAELRHGDTRPLDVRIELPPGVDVAAIDVGSVRLCRGVPGCANAVAARAVAVLGDTDADEVPDLTVTFDGGTVATLIADAVPPDVETLAITGRLAESGRWFVASATLAVIPSVP